MPEKVSGHSVNDDLANSFVTMTANFQRLSASEVIVVQGILKDLELDIVKKLEANPNMTEWRKSRYNALLAQTRDQIQATYGKITNQHQSFLAATAESAGKATEQVFKGVGVPLQSVMITPEQWKALASRSLIEGAPSAAWWAKQSQNLQDAFIQQMRIGYASGESIQQLVARVRGTPTGKKNNYIINGKKHVYVEFQGGIMDTGTRQAEALVRTSIQKIAADAQMEMFRQNADVIKGVMWLSTLDSRTTPLCRARDGLLYDLDGKPIGHKQSFLGGPPAHWNCRSTLVPVTKSFEELGAEPGITEEYLEAIGEGTRSSMNGEVPAALTFDSWFNTLPVDDQKAFLGPKKWEIWKKAGLNFQDMVDQRGNPLSLQQLANAYGFKIKQSIESGIPNVPKEMVSAIAVEQQAQMLASKMAKHAVQAEAASAKAALEELAVSADTLTKQVYDTYVEQIKDKSPQDALSFVQSQLELESKVKAQVKEISEEIKAILDNEKTPPADYIGAMEKKTALQTATQNAEIANLLPSQKMAVYKANLEQLKKTNKGIKASLSFEKKKNSLLAGLENDWKAHLSSIGEKPPVWDMQVYKERLNDFIAEQEAKAASKLAATSTNPIEQAIKNKALQEAKAIVPQGLKGSAVKTAQEYDKLAAEMMAEENAASVALADWEAKQGYKQALTMVKDEYPDLILPSEVFKEANNMLLDLSEAAMLKMNKIAASTDAVAKKAYSLVKNLEFDNWYAMSLKYEEVLATVQAELASAGMDAIKTVVGTHKLDGSILKIGGKEFDVMDKQGLADFKKYKSMHLSKYKQAILEGKKPSSAHKLVFDNLDEVEKKAFEDNLAKALAKKTDMPPNSNAMPEPGTLQMSQMEKYAQQKGSNEGGFYRDKRTGVEYYIKFPASEDVARNELLAAKLYQKAGIDVPELTLIQDGNRVGIASKIKAGLRSGKAQELANAIGSGSGYAVDAWLANWDVVGLSYDNLLLTEAGTAFRVDVGGALRYRAQGGLKGNAFGKIVTELESLRDAGMNPQSSTVFKSLAQLDLEDGVRKVLAISDEDIRTLVAEYGPLDKKVADDLAELLIARRNYLAEKFPHLTKPPVAPTGLIPGERIGADIFDQIRNARINGYAIPADKREIEDQSILAWMERDEQGHEFFGLRFKYTPMAAEIIRNKLGAAFVSEAELDPRYRIVKSMFDDFKKQFHFQWNVSHNKAGQIIDKTLVNKNLSQLDKTYKALIKALDSYDPGSAESFKQAYKAPLAALKKNLKQDVFNPTGLVAQGKFQSLDLYNFDITQAKKAPAVAEGTGGLHFEKVQGSFYLNKIENGVATRTSVLLPRGGNIGEVYEAVAPNGIRVRIWAGESTAGRALENQIEILTPGASKQAANKAMEFIKTELGLDVSLPTTAAQEEMYLRMIARHQGRWDLLDAADAMAREHKTVEEIATFLKGELSTKEKDITRMVGYNPQGVHEAFDTGFRRWYLPGIDTDNNWKKFTDDYVLYHSITNGDLATNLDLILNSGGKMVPTANRLRYGIPLGGMSPEEDLITGGADYFFTRIFSKENSIIRRNRGLIFNAKQAGRLDCICYNSDRFGRTTGDFVRKNSLHGIDGFKKSAKFSKNELIFKGGMSLFDGLEYINCSSIGEAQRVLAVLAKHGWTENWADGRPIKDLIRIGGRPIPE